MCTKLKVIKSYSGYFLALLSGFLYGCNGTLIKIFNLSFIEAVLIRCLVQIAISGLGFFISGCKISKPEESDRKKILNSTDDNVVVHSKCLKIFIIALQVKKCISNLPQCRKIIKK